MKVDIIVPTYNRAELLPETLKSVKDQSCHDWKCWIAEDGETQETLGAVKPFLEDNRFRYVPGKHSGTPAAPRNNAIRQGTAPYIAFLDDDDLWVPEKLEQQLEFIKRHPGCVLLGSNAYCWPGKDKWDQSLPLYFQKAPFGLIDYHILVQDDYLINSSVLIPRRVLEQSGLQNETLFSGPSAEDYELWLRIGALGETWLMPEPLIVYREAPALNVRHRSKTDRQLSYQTKAKAYESALKGVEDIPSPLTYPENERYAKACRFERDFYLAGPRFLGRLKHSIALSIKKHFFANK